MAVIEYEFPESWDDKGMDWNVPDPRCADYVMAIREALMERAAAAHVSLPSEVVAISPWKTVSIKAVSATVQAISSLARYYVNDGYREYKEDWSDFPKMWTYRDLVQEEGCGLYAWAHFGQLLENGGEWLRAIRNAIDRLHVIRVNQVWGDSYRRHGSIHDPPFDESIGTAMDRAFGEGQPSVTKFSSMPASFCAWSGNTHWRCPRPVEDGEDYEDNVDGYCGYAEAEAYRIRKVRSWLAGREVDLLLYTRVSAPTGPVAYSVELATSVLDTEGLELAEGWNDERIHLDDPSDVDIPLGDPDTIPRNAVVPTSDFDEQGNALYRRSAKRGYEAKVWALLDYGCENGFRFRANG